MSVGFQASGDRLPSTLQEDDDMQNVLSLGVKLDPNLVKRVKENHKNTIGTLDLTKLPDGTATWCFVAGDSLWASLNSSEAQEELSEKLLHKDAGYFEHSDWESS